MQLLAQICKQQFEFDSFKAAGSDTWLISCVQNTQETAAVASPTFLGVLVQPSWRGLPFLVWPPPLTLAIRLSSCLAQLPDRVCVCVCVCVCDKEWPVSYWVPRFPHLQVFIPGISESLVLFIHDTTTCTAHQKALPFHLESQRCDRLET